MNEWNVILFLAVYVFFLIVLVWSLTGAIKSFKKIDLATKSIIESLECLRDDENEM